MFKPIKVRKISEEIVDQIKGVIIEGKLKPGEKIPPERELIKQLGVSRISIREALKNLENQGFIDIRQGNGSFVRSIVTDRVKDPLNIMIRENVEKIFELADVRKELEAWSAYHAAQRATESEIEALGKITREMEKYLRKEKTPPAKLDADFHLTISQSSHNTVQAHLIFTIYDVFSEYFTFLIENICFNRKYYQAIYEQHVNIYKAIKQHKPEESRGNILEHLNFVEAELKTLLSATPGFSALPR
jgi:GntR family transcriptional repressor for pyruvate dehydrogenase complex